VVWGLGCVCRLLWVLGGFRSLWVLGLNVFYAYVGFGCGGWVGWVLGCCCGALWGGLGLGVFFVCSFVMVVSVVGLLCVCLVVGLVVDVFVVFIWWWGFLL